MMFLEVLMCEHVLLFQLQGKEFIQEKETANKRDQISDETMLIEVLL